MGIELPEVVTAKRRPRAIIVGGSVGGLFIGNMLHRFGWQVDIFERVSEGLSSRGVGIARHPELDMILAAAGIEEEGIVGVDVDGRSAIGSDGSVIGYHAYPQTLGPWARVFNPLLKAFPSTRYHTGHVLEALEQSKGRVVACFEGGRSEEAELVIGADGFRSTVRRLCAPNTVPRYAGYVAWRGIVEERDLSPQWRETTLPQYAFAFPQGGQLIGYPLAARHDEREPGTRRYTFLWYYRVPEGAALDDLLTDSSGRLHTYSIPPNLIRPDHIETLRHEAERLLPPRLAEVVQRSHGHLVQPIYDVMSHSIVFDRVALLGDAAYVARPHVGVGVLKAGQDALALAEALADRADIDAALSRYAATRIPPGQAAVQYGRYLGAFIERGLPRPDSDPSLGLDIPTILRTSGRPVPDPLPAPALMNA